MIDSNIVNNSSISAVKAKVELFNGSTLVQTCTCSDYLQDFTIERMGDESKFFGYGYVQKISVKLLDIERELTITTDNTIKVALGDGTNFIYPYPTFYITEVNRDQTTNTITITAYDALYRAAAHTYSELGAQSYTIQGLAILAASALSLASVSLVNLVEGAEVFDTYYESGGNFDGTESLREALNAIAEATQTIYFLDAENNLIFKRLDLDGDAVTTITKDDYFTLETRTNRRLSSICSVTELGDNLEANTGVSGTTQYIRNNPLWDIREDRATLVDNALAAVGGMTIAQFTCDWIGNYLIEIGDKLAFVEEDDTIAYAYMLNESLTYDGTITQIYQWEFSADENESAANPTSLGDALKQTFARVDKVNKEIELFGEEISVIGGKVVIQGEELTLTTQQTIDNTTYIQSIQMDVNGITQSVATVEKNVETELDGVKTEVDKLIVQSGTYLTEDEFKVQFDQEIQDAEIGSVKTSTGFTFDEQGLTVSKSDSEISTQITEDGMTVSRNDEVVLTANNEGVQAFNLHATTYLDIGTNSRFQDYETNRTGCFWIGG